MKIGYLGAGKLATPIALAVESMGHEVLIRDYAIYVMAALNNRKWPFIENRVDELLENTKIRNVSLSDLVSHSEIVFVAVQTPHAPLYEGITRLPGSRTDFDYSYLEIAVRQLSDELKLQNKKPVVVVISTVLPGTMRERILPLLPKDTPFLYSPAFPAMGTVINDYLNPEFVLVGGENEKAFDVYKEFCGSLYSQSTTPVPFLKMSIESAELSKVSYNSFISTKISTINAIGEMCHKIPNCDVDDVSNVLRAATKRIVSPAYMTSSVGDGGPCHPRDNIAMSWLARRLRLSFDPFGTSMQARENQTEWLADLIESVLKNKKHLYLFILGKSYKPECAITTGSSSMLLANILSERGIKFEHYDPFVDGERCWKSGPLLAFIATKHDYFRKFVFPRGSVVLDPHRYIPEQEGVEVIKIGVGK